MVCLLSSECVLTNIFYMSVLIVILMLLAVVVALVGVVGAILPAIPGPPLCFASLFVAYFTCPGGVSAPVLWWMLALTIVVTVLDYVAPIVLTKWGGGSKAATWGATIGMFAGLFFMPWGLLLGPLVGAFVGEMMHDAKVGQSLKVAALSFVSFLLTTGLKLFSCLMMTYYTFAAFWHTVSAAYF